MISHESSFKIVIKCKNNEIAQIIAKSLEPENQHVDNNTTINMQVKDCKLIVQLESSSSVSTIRNTIDDIISTINTVESVYKSVKS